MNPFFTLNCFSSPKAVCLIRGSASAFWMSTLLILSNISFLQADEDPFSYSRLNTFYDEFVCEQKDILSNAHLTEPCINSPPPVPPVPPEPIPPEPPEPPEPPPPPEPPVDPSIPREQGFTTFLFSNFAGTAIKNNIDPMTITDDDIYVLIITHINDITNIGKLDASTKKIVFTTVPKPTQGAIETFYVTSYGFKLNDLATYTEGSNTYRYCYIPSDNGTAYTSSRIYISIGYPINWRINSNGTIEQQDAAFSSTENTYYTLYGKVEYTKDTASPPQLFINSTFVDSFNIPLSVCMSTKPSPSYEYLYAGVSPTLSRLKVFKFLHNGFTSLPKQGAQTWMNLYKAYTSPYGKQAPLFVVSANLGPRKPTTKNPLFPIDYLNSTYTPCRWLEDMWTGTNAYYKFNTLRVTLTVPDGSQTCDANCEVDVNSHLKVTFQNAPWSPGHIDFGVPMTVTPFFTGSVDDYTVTNTDTESPNYKIYGQASQAAAKQFWQLFSCAFSVGFLYRGGPNPLTQPYIMSQVPNFYTSTKPCAAPWYDEYSKILHDQCTVPPYTQLYSSAYDDFLGTSGTLATQMSNNPFVIITIGDMTKSVIPDLQNDPNFYTVKFEAFPSSVAGVTLGGASVPPTGATFTNKPGTDMRLALNYTEGPYSGTVFSTCISPSTQCTTLQLPSGIEINLDKATNTVTIKLGAAPLSP